MILLGQEHGATIEQVRVRVVSVDQKDFGNVSAPRPALDMNDNVERVSDIGLNGSIRKFNATLQNATGKACEALLRGIRMDRGQRARVPRV